MKTKKPAAPQSSPETGIYGSGFSEKRGGFERVIIDGVSFDEGEICRRVNQGPAFDAMAEALKKIIHGFDSYPKSGPSWVEVEEARAALKLAQEVK